MKPDSNPVLSQIGTNDWHDFLVPVRLKTESIAEARSLANTRFEQMRKSENNKFESQLVGVLGEMAYASAAYGEWELARKVIKNTADFGLVDIKTRTGPYLTPLPEPFHIGYPTLAISMFCYALIDNHTPTIDSYIDVYLVGFAIGRNALVASNRDATRGYCVKVSLLHPMWELPLAWSAESLKCDASKLQWPCPDRLARLRP